MNELLAWIQFFLILYVIFYEYRRGSVSIFLWAMIEVVVGVAHLLSIYSGKLQYRADVYADTAIFGITFVLIYLVIRNIRFFKSNVNVIGNIREKIESGLLEKDVYGSPFFLVVKFLLLFSILGIAGFCIATFGSIGNTSWAGLLFADVSVYDINNVWGLLYLFGGMFSLLPGGLLFVQLSQKKYIAFIIWFAIMIVPTIITRNRAGILPMFVAMIMFLYMKNKKVTLRIGMKYFGFAIIVLVALYVLRVIRSYGTINGFVNNFNPIAFMNTILNSLKNSDGELGLINAFYYFMNGNGHFPEFGTLATYRRLLLMFIPTNFSLGLKPGDFAIAMGSAYINNYNNTAYSMHPTLFGDCYANLNYFGVFIAIFWAMLVDLIDRLCSRKNVSCAIFYSVIWGYAYILIGRGSVYNGVCVGVRLTVMIGLVYWICDKMRFSISKVQLRK